MHALQQNDGTSRCRLTVDHSDGFDQNHDMYHVRPQCTQMSSTRVHNKGSQTIPQIRGCMDQELGQSSEQARPTGHLQPCSHEISYQRRPCRNHPEPACRSPCEFHTRAGNKTLPSGRLMVARKYRPRMEPSSCSLSPYHLYGELVGPSSQAAVAIEGCHRPIKTQ